MVSSSLRNSLHRRNHKERSQLTHRQKYGVLEKHKDYVLRARDYHSKQDRLTRLKQKAAERNKDEFYFAMSKESTRGGVHRKDRGNVALPIDFIKILKTQDENYVRTMRTAELKKIDKIKAQLTDMADLLHQCDLDPEDIKTLRNVNVLKGSQRTGKTKHVLFAQSQDEVTSLEGSSSPAPVASTSQVSEAPEQEEDLGWKTVTTKKKGKRKAPTEPEAPKKRAKALEADDSDEEMASDVSPMHHGKWLVKELAARLKRDQQLRYAIREFEMQRSMMGKGARKKIEAAEKVEGEESEDDEDALDARGGRPSKAHAKVVDEETYKPRVYKWKLERKR